MWFDSLGGDDNVCSISSTLLCNSFSYSTTCSRDENCLSSQFPADENFSLKDKININNNEKRK